jgi:hypothetical protein
LVQLKMRIVSFRLPPHIQLLLLLADDRRPRTDDAYF